MVLIIDDDLSLGMALEKYFRFAGIDTVAISNPIEALTFLNVKPPRLILLDLHMPVIDGMTLLEAVRKDDAFRAIPIVVYTSDFSAHRQREALAAGAQRFIVKGTIGWEGLLREVRELLGGESQPLRLVQ